MASQILSTVQLVWVSNMSNAGLLLICILGVVVLYLIWDTYFAGQVEYVRSEVDGRDYLVQSQPDRQQAADLLANIRANILKLTGHLQKMYPDDERTKRLVRNLNIDNISEGTDNAKYTSYSINKGEKIVFCLRSRDANKKLVDLNTMMFVALHEVGHVCTESMGHTDEFWDNFRWLLEESIQVGIYRQQDFKTKPKEYCGITITDSPLSH